MLRLFTLLTAVLILSAPGSAYAWGKWGHVSVCELSYRFLTDDARKELKRVMAEHPAQEKLETNPYREAMTSYNYACLYADKNEYNRKVESSRHFLNLSRDETQVASEKCPNDKPCILGGIREERAILLDDMESDESRADALVMLGHWIGDLHQPLHVSFRDDLGGNQVSKLKGGRCSGASYLHAVWDSCILDIAIFQKRIKKYKELVKKKKNSTIVYRFADDLEKRYSQKRIKELAKAWLASTPKDWANESYVITRTPSVNYCILKGDKCVYEEDREERPRIGIKKPGKKASKAEKAAFRKKQYEHNKKVVINDKYLNDHAPIVEQRILQAAARLANIINTGFDDDYDGNLDYSRFKGQD